MGVAIEGHGLGSELGPQGGDFAQLVGRIFMEDMHDSLPGRDEYQPGGVLKSCGIGSRADGHRLQDLSRVSVHHYEHLRLAPG